MAKRPAAPDRDAILATAEAACREAGALVVDAHRTGLQVRTKSNAYDLVTDSDQLVEQRIIARITKDYPDSSFYAEESGRSGDGQLLWCIDPIDGTNNFVGGIPLSCVSIAAFWADEPAAACVFDPWRDEAFSICAGGRTTLNGTAVTARGSRTPPVLLTDYPSCGEESARADWSVVAAMARDFDVRRLGTTALALAYVAAGRAAAACNVDVRRWDVAAGRMLVSGAGGDYLPLLPSRPPKHGFAAHAAGARRAGERLVEILSAGGFEHEAAAGN